MYVFMLTEQKTAYKANWLREIWSYLAINWQYVRHFDTVYPVKENATQLQQILRSFCVMLSLNMLIVISTDWIAVVFFIVFCVWTLCAFTQVIKLYHQEGCYDPSLIHYVFLTQ